MQLELLLVSLLACLPNHTLCCSTPQGLFTNPERNAFRQPGAKQPMYRVRFRQASSKRTAICTHSNAHHNGNLQLKARMLWSAAAGCVGGLLGQA